ncbi:MAG TPA: hypothetical protein VLX09_02920 [Stellaceae bacterium]|nr:hypothetical protein [Stellaceae bacterium]
MIVGPTTHGEKIEKSLASGRLFGRRELFLLVVVPAVFLCIGRFQFFPPPGWVDPGIYLGYFLNFPQALKNFGPVYFSTRLPWTLVGFLAHRIFAPDVAQYVLDFGFYYLALGAIYLIVAPRYGRAAGVVAAWWLAFNPLWIAAVMRGYVDGPAMSYLFGALACLINSGRLFGRRVDLCLFGAFVALSVLTQLVLGLFIVCAIGAYILAERPQWRDFCGIVVWGGVGIVAATVSLSLFGAVLGAPYFFFAASLPQVKQAFSGFGINYRLPLAEWLPTAYRLLPAFAFAITGAVFAYWHRARRPAMVIGASVFLWASIAGLAANDFSLNNISLQVSHYASYLLLGQALTFAALAGELVCEGAEASGRHLTLLLAMIFAASIPVLAVERVWAWEAASRAIFTFWMLPAALFAVAAVAAVRGRGRIALPLLMLATALAASANLDTRRIFQVSDNPDYQPFYQAAIRLNDIVEGAHRDRRLLLWYNAQSFSTGDPRRDAWLVLDLYFDGTDYRLNALDSLAALWLWDRALLNREMPALTAREAKKVITPGGITSVVLLCQRVDDCASGVAALQAYGITTELRVRERIVEGELIDLTVIIVDARSTS